jgi:hypothetical protein
LGRLVDKPAGVLTKLSVFVPTAHIERVRAAICDAGAGHVGNYDFCTFGTAGEGTFRGNDETRPFLGEPGRLEKAQEIRLETVFPKGLERRVLKALFEAHPYEEVAFDLFPVKQPPAKAGLVSGLGYGFWGDFPKARPFPEVVKDVTRIFQVRSFLLTDPAPKKVKRIAFVAGKGASFTEVAAANGCDLFITGEAGYHTALDGSRKGVAVMELGHRESELFFLRTMEKWLRSTGLKTVSLNVPTQKFWR